MQNSFVAPMNVVDGGALADWLRSTIPEFINGRPLSILVTNINGLRGNSKQAEIVEPDRPVSRAEFLDHLLNTSTQAAVHVLAEDAVAFAWAEGLFPDDTFSRGPVMFYHAW